MVVWMCLGVYICVWVGMCMNLWVECVQVGVCMGMCYVECVVCAWCMGM